MNVQTHPSAAELASYALGQIALEPVTGVLAHLHFCGVCAAIVRTFEETEGRRLSSIVPVGMAVGAVTRCLALIEGEPM